MILIRFKGNEFQINNKTIVPDSSLPPKDNTEDKERQKKKTEVR